jgi:NAD(P)-dependent dehydrogenase (short-subunit alcohol dehydrogenase family)
VTDSARASPRLAGKSALVTGASRGVGRAVALRLAGEGARVAVAYRSQAQAAAAVVAEIEAAGGEAIALQADVGAFAEIAGLYQRLDSAWRTGEAPYLDILVNNAALASNVAFAEVDEGEFDRVMAVNFKGPFFMIQQALPRLRDHGRIINVSALGARRAYPDVPVYTPAKAALNTLTALLARDAGKRGVTVNAVAPGAVETDMLRARLSQPGAREDYAARTALGRPGAPADIAAVVAFLASEDARWITGETLYATGGLGL